MPGTPITRGKFVWPGGFGGCPTGHGCSKQLEACVEQNYKNQTPEGPAWCADPDSWAALRLASCQAYVAAALTPPKSAGLGTWAPPRPCHTGLGIPYLLTFLLKPHRENQQGHVHIHSAFSRSWKLRLRAKSLVQSHAETKEQRQSWSPMCRSRPQSLRPPCLHCAVCVCTLVCV